MKTALIVFTVVVVVPPLVGLAFYYWRYRTSPVGRWKYDVLRHIHDLKARQAELRTRSSGFDKSMARLADEAFARHLRTVPLERLLDFPNIGPATLTRLEDAGCRRLADMVEEDFGHLPGIGPARANDVRAAVRSLVREAQSRFNAGGCPEAQEYRRRVDELRQADRERIAARDRELAAVGAALEETFRLLPLAEAVTFWRSFLNHEVVGLTAEVLARPLPEPKPLPPAPAPAVVAPAPAPPAVPPVVATIAARPAPEPFTLPPATPVSPPPPADLFRAELNGLVKPSGLADHPGLPRMRAVVGLGFVIARVDGRIAQAERKAIRAFLEQSFGHDPVLVRNIDPLMERTEKAIPDEDAALAAVRSAVPAAERAVLYQWAERIAGASGERNQKERDALARIAVGLGALPSPLEGEGGGASPPGEGAGRSHVGPPHVLTVSHPTGTAFFPSPPAPLPQGERGVIPDPRAVLDIAPDTPLDPDLIRRRYQSLTDKLDPAKAAAFGPEFVRMAEEKRARVRAAAEALIAPFGEPLEKPAAPPPTDLRHNPDLDDVFGA